MLINLNIREQNIDFVYYTGDFADHFAWNMTRENVKESIEFVTNLFKNLFGELTVIPVLGNHDIHPANL